MSVAGLVLGALLAGVLAVKEVVRQQGRRGGTGRRLDAALAVLTLAFVLLVVVRIADLAS